MKIKLIRIILSAILLIFAYIIEKNLELAAWQLLLIYLVPYLIIGYDVIIEAIEGIVKLDPFDENFLMCVATIGAMCIGFLPHAETEFLEAVFVMLFFQLGEYFEHFAEDKSRKSIVDLMDIRPDKANKLINGKIVEVSPDELLIGDTVEILPGEKIPADGTVIEGKSSLNTVALTGESVPKNVTKGDKIISGCVNNSGVLKVIVDKLAKESTASKILHLVEEAGESKSKSETFIRRFAKKYTPIVVILAIIIAFIPPFFCPHYPTYAEAFQVWLYRALTFLVVSCPCALVISIPLSFFCGIGGAGHKGILIKGGSFMESLARLKTIVLDKTGTLTHGQFAVNEVIPNGIEKEELLSIVANIEQYSTHPIAVALCNAYTGGINRDEVKEVKEVAGQGLCATIEGKTVAIGNEHLMKTVGIDLILSDKEQHLDSTVVYVAIDGNYVGKILISDSIKTDSKDAISLLDKLSINNIIMLTGDKQEVAASVAKELHINKYYSELLPADKVKHLENLIESKSNINDTLAFVGDGINDAPVLARADVGIAMGGFGSDAAIEAADVVLMDDKPSKIAQTITIARRTISIARQNAIFAIGIKIAILLLATFGVASMGLAVFADVGVMVLAVLNATRALKV